VVAAGALVLDPENIISLANMGFLSPDSRCFSYDARANGYAKGEGVGVVILQKLSEAVKSGNSIRAVIRATSTNSNGNNAGITQPSRTAQKDLIKRAYEKAGLSINETKVSLVITLL
jgi:acyl transferase domain-containing protein